MLDCLKMYAYILNSQMKKYAQKQKDGRGGAREGAGRPDEGKARFTVTLDAENAARAKSKTGNFSRLLDDLLARWLVRN